jgi:CBS domain-containing protein
MTTDREALAMRQKVKDLMIGLSEIAVIDENSTIFEAVLRIGIARNQHPGAMRCPVALVADSENNVAGFLEFRNLLGGLDPGYVEFAESAKKSGFSSETIRSEMQKHGLLEEALEAVCRKAGEASIKTLVTIPEDGQTTSSEASINEAIYQMIVAGKDYLCVKDGRAVVGLISLSDILGHICDTVKSCRM